MTQTQARRSRSSPLSSTEKDHLYKAVSEKFDRWYGPELKRKGACLYWTQLATIALSDLGLRALPQAGDLSWLMVPPELDDGVSPTHFTFQWCPDDEGSRAAQLLGLLPEIHCWVALPDEGEFGEIVDFSTGFLRRQAEQEHGFRWSAPDPPPYLWCPADELPPGTSYIARMEAIRFLFQFIKEKVTQKVAA